MKPDWSRSPEWANYAAQEASGTWYWYSHRPNYSEICTEWQSPGQRQIIPRVEFRPQMTMEERPVKAGSFAADWDAYWIGMTGHKRPLPQ